MKYTPHTEKDKSGMLKDIGVDKIEDLFYDIPEEVQKKAGLDITNGISEFELRKLLKNIAGKNVTCDDFISFLGAGAYDHYIPAFVDQLLLRSEFYTAYTPYQPEVSQGTLQSIFEYQTLICELTGMEVANASMYDGASAAAEAVLMSAKATRSKKAFISSAVHPEYREVINTYAAQSMNLESINVLEGQTDYNNACEKIDKDTAAIVIQYPNFFGTIEELEKFAKLAHDNKAHLIVVVADPVSLGILKSPGEQGADIVVGEGQSFGNNLCFGGPYLGFMASTQKNARKLPGRIVGMTEDVDGKTGYVLTLQAREQHIRREKATSNICSNQALCALAATMSLCAFGKSGLKEMACNTTQKAHYAYEKILGLQGVETVIKKSFFSEFVIKFSKDEGEVLKELKNENILGGISLNQFYDEFENCLLISLTELKTKNDIDYFVDKLGGILA